MSLYSLLTRRPGAHSPSHLVRSLSTIRPRLVSPQAPSGYAFPTTTDFSQSPFKDISVGHSRVVLPTFASKQEEEVYRKEHLAAVFRVLARQGHVEGISGHCSVRSAVDPSKFYINPYTKSFYRMRASDLVLMNADGSVVQDGSEAQQRSVDASATGLHAPIYRLAGDVQSVVHVHGAYSKAFSALGKPIAMINQDACAFDGGIVDIGFDGVVTDENEGAQIAGKLAQHSKIALLQNHGSLAIGRTMPDEAAWWFLNFEMICRAQLLVVSALKDGEKPILVNEEARKFTLQETGYPEMGWLSFASYYEREEWETGGDFKL